MATKKDARYIQSEENIRRAFLSQMLSVGFHQIRIKDLIEAADINRSTFYAHYEDKYALLSAFEDELIDGFRRIASTASVDDLLEVSSEEDRLHQYFLSLAEYISDNRKLFSVLFQESCPTTILPKLQALVSEFWELHQIPQHFTIRQNYVQAGLLHMVAGLIEEWIYHDFEETPEAFATILTVMIRGVHMKVLS